jgi:hypothetical protein
MSTLQRLLSDQKRILARGWKRKLKHDYAGGSVENMSHDNFLIVGKVPIKLRAIYLLRFFYAKKSDIAMKVKSEEREVEFYALKQAAEFLWQKRYDKYCQKRKFFEKHCESKDERNPFRGTLKICRNWLIIVVYPSARGSSD